MALTSCFSSIREYQSIPRLDTYDEEHLDDEQYDAMDPAARAAAEKAMRKRDRQVIIRVQMGLGWIFSCPPHTELEKEFWQYLARYWAILTHTLPPIFSPSCMYILYVPHFFSLLPPPLISFPPSLSLSFSTSPSLSLPSYTGVTGHWTYATRAAVRRERRRWRDGDAPAQTKENWPTRRRHGIWRSKSLSNDNYILVPYFQFSHKWYMGPSALQ